VNLLIAGALALLFILMLRRLALGYPRRAERLEHVYRHEAAFLDAAAEALFPDQGAVPLAGKEAQIPRYVDRHLAALEPRVRLQIRALILLFEQSTLVFAAPGAGGRRRFTQLSVEQRVRVLEGWSESRLFLRLLVFTALRAVLTLGYLGNPVAARALRIAPFAFESPVREADLLYPPIGAHPREIRWKLEDLTPPGDGTPISLDSPLHPEFVERPL